MGLAGDWWAYLFAAIFAVPFAVLVVESIAALLPRRAMPLAGQRPRVAILVPAHNEELQIQRTLARITEQLQVGDRLIVVADNCTDRTADLARQSGAEAIERSDQNRRGKGYALDFGLKHLSENPPEVVIVIDADTEVLPGAFDALANSVKHSGHCAQACYLMTTNPQLGPAKRAAEFAFLFKNAIRPRGMSRLGLPCLLYGAGMAIPWSVISKIDLGHGHITEDIWLGIEVAKLGAAADYVPEAQVRGEFPEDKHGTATQRQRWEHGHLQTMFREVPKLLMLGISRGRMDLIGLAFHLGVPPLAFLLLVGCAVAITLGLVHQPGPAVLLASAIVAALMAILLTWWRFGRACVRLRDMAILPFYILAKVPLYFRFFFKPQQEWVRTKRTETTSLTKK